MYLKRLEMQGFKSFVDKTVLEFDRGITAIVGPNGSGKSNISDAVKWVLGEQSPKTLRGSRMEDVIFAGTQSRKPVGMTEVSLVMDNEDGTLHIDYLEVCITRRLYRSGESEYLINGAPCRLKDILMLFADTGIGRDGYSIIGQGCIDEILNNRSEDRRNIFEDASGIMKYRMRKAESERKLAATEQNLLRIGDIVRELEMQIKPLEKQSETARKYLGLKYALRDIEVGVLSRNIENAEQRLGELDGLARINTDDQARCRQSLQKLEDDNREQTELSRTLGEQLAAYRAAELEHEKRVERLRAEIAVDREKMEAAARSRTEADSRIGEQLAQIANAEAEIAQVEESLTAIRTQLDAVQQEGGAKADRLTQVDAELAAAHTRTEEQKNEIVQKKLAYAQGESALRALAEQVQMIAQRKKALDGELHVLDESENAASGELEKAEAEAERQGDRATEAKQVYKNNAERLNTLRARADADGARAGELSGVLKSTEAQCRLLREMEAGYEGYARGVREVMQRCKKDPAFGAGIYGAVAQLITVPGEYELAIETALGQSYQNIITESERETQAAIAYLKEHRCGRATFMPLTAVRGRRFEESLERQLRGLSGYLGVAADHVTCDVKFRQAVEGMLGRVAVFRTLDDAVAAARAHRYAFMCVTLEGDILRTSGAITGGAQERGSKSAVSVLARTREIPELEQKCNRTAAELRDLYAQIDAVKAEALSLEETQNAQFDTVRTLEAEVAGLQSRCAALRERQQERRARRAKLLDELKEQIRLVQDANRRSEEIRAGQAGTEAELRDAEEKLLALGRAEADMQQKQSGVQADLFALKMQENSLHGREENMLSDIRRMQNDIEGYRARIEYYETQKRDGRDAAASLEEEIHALEARAGVSDLDARKAREDASRTEARKAELDGALGGMLSRITEISAELTRLGEEASRLEIQRVRAENEVNSSKNRLWEEYELTYTEAQKLASQTHIEDYKEASKQIAELRSAIKALGPVNVNAVEEYENTVKRYEFMAAQSKDMNESRAKLQKVVNELTAVMRTQFMEQFAIIRRNFSEVFTELFGGGKADIVLAEGEDVLECGIDIRAQPPGKKLQNMMLLSGGERALTAIALLFGILRMRPSPFCLLDEIEAALDDANVYRLSDYLGTVSRDTQFIMITHRKGTMENAESLYGVTMEEKGISKVLSLRMNA